MIERVLKTAKKPWKKNRINIFTFFLDGFEKCKMFVNLINNKIIYPINSTVQLNIYYTNNSIHYTLIINSVQNNGINNTRNEWQTEKWVTNWEMSDKLRNEYYILLNTVENIKIRNKRHYLY